MSKEQYRLLASLKTLCSRLANKSIKPQLFQWLEQLLYKRGPASYLTACSCSQLDPRFENWPILGNVICKGRGVSFWLTMLVNSCFSFPTLHWYRNLTSFHVMIKKVNNATTLLTNKRKQFQESIIRIFFHKTNLTTKTDKKLHSLF